MKAPLVKVVGESTYKKLENQRDADDKWYRKAQVNFWESFRCEDCSTPEFVHFILPMNVWEAIQKEE